MPLVVGKAKPSPSEHFAIDEGGTPIEGPDAVGVLWVHDDGNGVIGLDSQYWSPEVKQPRSAEEAFDFASKRGKEPDIEGGFFWDMSPKGWKGHSKFVSGIIGRNVTLEEGGVKTDWKANSKLAEEIDESG